MAAYRQLLAALGGAGEGASRALEQIMRAKQQELRDQQTFLQQLQLRGANSPEELKTILAQAAGEKELVPTPGPNGPVYAPKTAGTRFYEKPEPAEYGLTPGPEGTPVYGKKGPGMPAYVPPEKPEYGLTPGPEGTPVYGVKAPGVPAYEPPKTPELKPIPGPGGKPIYGTPKAGDPVYVKPPEPVPSFGQPVQDLDPLTGLPTGRAMSWDAHTGTWVAPKGPGPNAKVEPGAAQRVARMQAVDQATQTIDEIERLVEIADKAGYIGPAGGRLGYAVRRVGSSGNPRSDELIGALKSAATVLKPQLALALGEQSRGASSIQMMKMFESAMNTDSGSRTMLHGALEQFRRAISAPGTAGGFKSQDFVPPAPPPGTKEYLDSIGVSWPR